MLPKNLVLLRNYLETNSQIAKEILGVKYLDILLITNAQYGFSQKRDKAMYGNFKLLYHELSSLISGKPKFFSSFGIGHINPDNRNGISNVLSSAGDSPVKNSTIILGVQYINCSFNTTNNLKQSEGVLNFLCPQKTISAIVNKTNNDQKMFRYISDTEFYYPNCDRDLKKLKGTIVIENCKASANWTWE